MQWELHQARPGLFLKCLIGTASSLPEWLFLWALSHKQEVGLPCWWDCGQAIGKGEALGPHGQGRAHSSQLPSGAFQATPGPEAIWMQWHERDQRNRGSLSSHRALRWFVIQQWVPEIINPQTKDLSLTLTTERHWGQRWWHASSPWPTLGIFTCPMTGEPDNRPVTSLVKVQFLF